MHKGRVFLGIVALAIACTACTSPPHHPQAARTTTTTSTTTTTLPSSPGAPPPAHRSAGITVSTTAMQVGESVTISGADCPAGAWGTANLERSGTTPDIFTGGIGLYDGESEFTTSNGILGVTVDHSGHWTMTASVPMLDPGPATLHASCASNVAGGIGPVEFTYHAIPVSLTTHYAIEVEPALSVAPGTTLTVTAIGGGCGIPGYAYVGLYTTTAKVTQLAEGTGRPGYGAPSSSPSGEQEAIWSDTLPVPSTLAPGHYFVEADCFYSRGLVLGSYPGVTLTVT